MTRAPAALVAALLAFVVVAAQPGAPADAPAPILVLVSFDGWRSDYADRVPAPNFRALARRGVRAQALIPSFPTLTFPNHYTIVTGLYPAHHGIVSNVMSDPSMPERFRMSAATSRDPAWWGGEPLWVTAARQGLRTAAMFWPGSEVSIHGVRPDRWVPFDEHVPAARRTAQVLEWLGLPEAERPSLVTLYFNDVDDAGHDFGPESGEVKVAVAKVDAQLGILVEGIRRLGLGDRAIVAVVSDHGMAAVSDTRTIWLDDSIDVTRVDIVESSGYFALAPLDDTPKNVDAIYQRLRRAHHRLQVFTRDTIPDRLHYRDNPRIPPIIGLPDAGWTATTHAERRRRQTEGRRAAAGSHGFDPASPLMQAIFEAAGPGVSRGLVVPPIENVHLYNFFCAVLKLTPAPNDGDPARVSAWIQRSP